MSDNRVTHGMTGTPEYSSWQCMKARCNNPNHVKYSYYGGRGIGICSEWADSFEIFLRDMGRQPEGLTTIERIDPDADYFPENCKWASRKTQSRSTVRLQRNNKSGYRGVYFNKQKKKWQAQITVDYKCKPLGRYYDPVEAAMAYDRYVIDNGLEHTLNFQH